MRASTVGNVFAGSVRSYFQLPSWFVDSGILLKFGSTSPVCLYVVLARLSHRFTARDLELSNTELERLTGLSAKTLHDARECLEAHGLIHATKTNRRVYCYELLNPSTGLKLNKPPGRTGIRRYVREDALASLDKYLPKPTAQWDRKDRSVMEAPTADEVFGPGKTSRW
jgi:hypothetical protein